MTWEEVWAVIKDWLLATGVKIVIALVVLVVSFKLINFFSKRTLKSIEKKSKAKGNHFDKTIANSLAYGVKIVLKILIVLCLIAYLGFNVSSLTAVIASTGVGVGLALNGALSNLAGGILLLVTRPFKEDDYISAGNFDGTVEHIRLCHTVLRTPDNKVVYIPNSTLSSGTVVNFSEKPVRRLDLNYSIDYGEDFGRAREIILKIFEEHELVLKDPAPMVRISEHAESAIVVLARCWVAKDDYWTVKFDMNERVKAAFDSNGVTIPFNQIDVHIK